MRISGSNKIGDPSYEILTTAPNRCRLDIIAIGSRGLRESRACWECFTKIFLSMPKFSVLIGKAP